MSIYLSSRVRSPWFRCVTVVGFVCRVVRCIDLIGAAGEWGLAVGVVYGGGSVSADWDRARRPASHPGPVQSQSDLGGRASPRPPLRRADRPTGAAAAGVGPWRPAAPPPCEDHTEGGGCSSPSQDNA